jgi:rubrerythrin
MDKKLKQRIRKLEDEIEALIIAIPKEESSYNFYMSLANQTESEGARMMFKHLAEEEFKHKSGLIKLVEKLKAEIDYLRKPKEGL